MYHCSFYTVSLKNVHSDEELLTKYMINDAYGKPMYSLKLF